MSVTAGNLARDEARGRAETVSDVHYDVHLGLVGDGDAGDERTFRSDTTVRFRSDRPVTFLDLSARTVERIELNGAEVDSGAFDGTRVALSGLEAGENEVRVVAVCEYQHTGAGLHRAVDPTDGAVYLHTQFEPFDAHLVYACFDQPDVKATFRFVVDAPEDWEVVSNAPLASRDGARREFETTRRLSPYVTAVVAGPYTAVTDVHGDVPLGFYARRSMAEHLEAEELLDLTRRGLDFFADIFDLPYPFRKYDQLFVPEFNFGAMENPGCVTFSERYLFRGHVTDAERESRANTLLHEMAHMWFGDLVTMRWWDDLWLNESFATFMATLASERATRFTNAWVTFADEEKAWAKMQDQLPTTHPISTEVPDLDSVHQNFDGITYAKGASVLRHLVAWVGEEEFLAGCRSYFREFAYGNAELRDLLDHLQRTSGRDLETWAKEWLQTAGVNTLAAVTSEDDGGYRSFAVEQTAPEEHPTLRPHRVGVALFDLHPAEDGDGGRLVRRRGLQLDVTGPSTDVDDLVGEAVADLVLVNDGDLTFAKLRLDERSLATVSGHLDGLDEPLARTLLWGAAWDMVRDGTLPAGGFVDLVVNNAASEPDTGVLQTLLARALAAVEFYGDPTQVASRLDALAEHARSRTDAEAPGSDRQLAWARNWIATARAPRHTGPVGDLLDGTVVVEGLDVDTELRWHVVKALAGAGAVDEDVIAAEHRRDPTDLGERQAANARAARPSPAAKEEAWERVVGEPDMSHSLMKAIMAGFRRRDQVELLAPFRDRYFDALLPVWRERQLEVAIAFAHAMYPQVVVEDATVERTDAWLGSEDVPGPIRRALLEERDAVVRALRARRVDAS